MAWHVLSHTHSNAPYESTPTDTPTDTPYESTPTDTPIASTCSLAPQGHYQLNVYKPVMVWNVLESAELLAAGDPPAVLPYICTLSNKTPIYHLDRGDLPAVLPHIYPLAHKP